MQNNIHSLRNPFCLARIHSHRNLKRVAKQTKLV
uniref:Uncharacterized protein n=1 Tax=Arundo donax TaxID=35708 RepID=A0A0A9E9S9_ARUDO